MFGSLLVLGAVLMVGCGGGGSGGGGPVTVTGTVLSVTTNAPVVGATVTIAGNRATTGTTGSFSLSGAPSGTTQATIVATGLATETLPLKLTAGLDGLGNIYMADAGTANPYTAVVTGTVVTQITNAAGQVTNQPVGGATVSISGQTILSATDGTFSLSGLPVGLGSDPNVPIGTISATGFNPKPIIAAFPLISGVNPFGLIPIGAPISGTVPGAPYTLVGQVTHGGKPVAGLQVFVGIAGTTTILGPAGQTDSNGDYYFWLVPGTYNLIVETGGGNQATASGVVVGATNTITTAPTITY